MIAKMLSVIMFMYNLAHHVTSYSIFPAGKCANKLCGISPYVLNTTRNDGNKFCFTINPIYCDPREYCCNRLNDVLEKIVIKTNISCFGSLDSVYVDDVKKSGGVFFDNYTGFAEVRITSLRLRYDTALYKTICIGLKSPCDSVEKLCASFDCMYSIYDPFTHNCCPTCNFGIIDTLPNDAQTYVPIMNNPPNKPQTICLMLIIKAPIFDLNNVHNILCPKLLNSRICEGCDILHESNTGIYYATNICQYEEFNEALLRNQDYWESFASMHGIMCNSVVIVYHPNFEKVLRYKINPCI